MEGPPRRPTLSLVLPIYNEEEVIPELHKQLEEFVAKLGLEAEVSGAICFLLSPAAAFITGITLPIDGGRPLGNPSYPIGAPPPAKAFDGFHRAVAPEALGDGKP